MSLENLNCPQFVDFTSVETFDIHDGADFFFGKVHFLNFIINFNTNFLFKLLLISREKNRGRARLGLWQHEFEPSK